MTQNKCIKKINLCVPIPETPTVDNSYINVISNTTVTFSPIPTLLLVNNFAPYIATSLHNMDLLPDLSGVIVNETGGYFFDSNFNINTIPQTLGLLVADIEVNGVPQNLLTTTITVNSTTNEIISLQNSGILNLRAGDIVNVNLYGQCNNGQITIAPTTNFGLQTPSLSFSLHKV